MQSRLSHDLMLYGPAFASPVRGEHASDAPTGESARFQDGVNEW